MNREGSDGTEPRSARKPMHTSEAYILSLEAEVDDLRTRLHAAECDARACRAGPPDAERARLERLLAFSEARTDRLAAELEERDALLRAAHDALARRRAHV